MKDHTVLPDTREPRTNLS